MSALVWLAANWRRIAFLLPCGIAAILGLMWAIQKGETRHYEKLWTNEKASHKSDNDRWTAAQALANAQATSAKLAAEAHYAQIQKDKEHEITLARADADARLRRWMRDHAAGQGSAGKADLSGASGSAAGPDAASGATFLVAAHDLELCTSAVVGLEGWQAWWSAIQATKSPEENNE